MYETKYSTQRQRIKRGVVKKHRGGFGRYSWVLFPVTETSHPQPSRDISFFHRAAYKQQVKQKAYGKWMFMHKSSHVAFLRKGICSSEQTLTRLAPLFQKPWLARKTVGKKDTHKAHFEGRRCGTYRFIYTFVSFLANFQQ